ncbi:hypothetical protein CYY_006421 [Polysphondylium violaceum]|uniref:UDP-N-acetylmuramoyl-L-alanyl-D-glutamate synthetase n=1 Tax=Polysphondylium violaceum TaxID=133409 RepID=A0A8J4PR06_9MYCE|nr:hypothetical protein CYY_006421 [Polysphondylium violaceum]
MEKHIDECNILKNKKVVIVGLGITGVSCIDYFLSRGISPKVIDTREDPPDLINLRGKVETHVGGFNDDWIMESDLIIVSPSIGKSHPSLKGALEKGIEILGDIELFCREINGKAPIVAITGTNGKSTVTTLVGLMAKESGLNVAVGGNIGVPALSLLDRPYDLYVLELSSYQLETIYTLNPAASTILNVTEDHMYRYPKGMEEYREVKLRIYEKSKACIINLDDPSTFPINGIDSGCIGFGIDNGQYHIAQCDKGETWLNVRGENVLNVRNMKISNQHNHLNALAAIALSEAVGIPLSSCLKVLQTFSGLPHRFHLAFENKGVRWINDSKATNVGSTLASLSGINMDKGTLWLLLGGEGKGMDFTPLKPCLMNRNVRIYCFGKDGPQLATLLPSVTTETANMEEAMRLLAKQTQPNDIVLLAPACASIDQFKNFEERGNIFTSLAKELG